MAFEVTFKLESELMSKGKLKQIGGKSLKSIPIAVADCTKEMRFAC